jgi:cytochrome bd-I ubiquinol oxidase subunit X
MWYFAWILGLGLAVTFGILNAMWYEVREQERELLRGESSAEAETAGHAAPPP